MMRNKDEKKNIAVQRYNKIKEMMEREEQNKQMALEMFTDNAKFSNPDYQSKQAKIKYFKEYQSNFIYAAIFKADRDFDQFTDFIMAFYDWIVVQDFPLVVRKKENAAAKKQTEDTKMVDQKEEKKPTFNTATMSAEKERQPMSQPKYQYLETPNQKQRQYEPPTPQPIPQQIPQPKSQSKPTPPPQQRQHYSNERTSSPINQPSARSYPYQNTSHQKDQGRGISPKANYTQNVEPKHHDTKMQDANYPIRQTPKNQVHFNRTQQTRQEVMKKILNRIYECFDQPQKRHKISADITVQIDNLRRMQGLERGGQKMFKVERK